MIATRKTYKLADTVDEFLCIKTVSELRNNS